MFCGTKRMEYGWITIWRTRGLGICSTLRILRHFTLKVTIVVNVIMAQLLWDISNRRISTTSLVSFCFVIILFFFFLNFKFQTLILILYTWKIINFFWFLTFKRCFWKGFSWSKVISIRMKSNGIVMIRNKFYIFLYLWLREKATFIIHRIQYSILIFNFLSSSSNKNYIIP